MFIADSSPTRSGLRKVFSLRWYSEILLAIYIYNSISLLSTIQGGLDGATFSNSFLYELKLGWKGMLIEGNADNFKTMVQTRPCVNNVWAAACPAKQSHLYMTDGAGTASTRSFSSNVLKVLTPCRTLKSLFEEYGIDTIDFFSLDVESAELDVLRTIDFSRVKINVLIFELDKLVGVSNSNNNGLTNSTDSVLRHVAIHDLLTAAGMIKLASNAKDMPACIPAERRYSIHGSAVYVSPEFRDDICPPDAKVAMGGALAGLTDLTAAAIAAKEKRVIRKQQKMQRKKNQG